MSGLQLIQRPAALATLIPAALAALIAALAGPAPALAGKSFQAATSGHNSELIETAPIERAAKRSRRVAFSLGPNRLPTLHADDRLRASGEVTLTTTCVDSSSRCIGRPYGYNPKLGARLVLARDAGSTGGRGTIDIGRRVTVSCHQHRPNRNHHCPLVIESSKRIDRTSDLPCRPQRCHLNLVIDAHHRNARPGNVVVVGADRPGGAVDQNKGRLNALVLHAGSGPPIKRRRSSRPVSSTLPMGHAGSGGHRVTFSVKLPTLRRGDAILARARQLTDIGHLHYSAFVSAELIVATSRKAVEPAGLARKAITYRGHLGAANGFNCTQGKSGYDTPCLTRKVALGKVTRDVVGKKGGSVPLYVNLISRSFPKLATAGSGDAAGIGGGSLTVERIVR
ncbi:MAG: hypothetical protein WBC01_07945 [Solirubrobacterales bacterium]